MTTIALPSPVYTNPPVVKVQAAHGRIYVSGPHAGMLRSLPGATQHERTGAYMLSLTLESLRAARAKLGVTKEQMARYCSPDVLRWAKAAGEQERILLTLHRMVTDGYRADLPWLDNRTGTPNPAGGTFQRCDPFGHQEVMATVACKLDGCAYLCEMGTGKSRAAAETAAEKIRTGAAQIVVVVCPRSVIGTWEREIRRWTNLKAIALRGPIKDRAEFIGSMRYTLPLLDYNVVITNYDALHALVPALTQLMDSRRVMLLFDEMHKMANPQARVTKAAMELTRHASSRLGLTGTPIPNKVEGIWSQWYIIDLGVQFGANYVQFRREFFTEYSWSWERDPVEGALDTIGQRLRLRGLRYRKEDCLDLPPKVYETEDIEMIPAQKKAYKEMEEWLVTYLRDADQRGGEAATAPNQLVMILRLTQITSGFVKTETGGIHCFEPNPKLAKCVELVRDVLASGRAAIVWAMYVQDINRLMHAFADLRPARIDGSQQGARGARNRDEEERRFQAGETKLLIGNAGAGGLGLNLQQASAAMYYSQDYSLVKRMQSEDRCHRSGSEMHAATTGHITYIDLTCGGTIDETITQALAEKKSIHDLVVDLRRQIGA